MLNTFLRNHSKKQLNYWLTDNLYVINYKLAKRQTNVIHYIENNVRPTLSVHTLFSFGSIKYNDYVLPFMLQHPLCYKVAIVIIVALLAVVC